MWDYFDEMIQQNITTFVGIDHSILGRERMLKQQH